MSEQELRRLREANEELMTAVKEQQEFIKSVTGVPSPYATVINCLGFNEETKQMVAVIAWEGKYMEVAFPKELEVKPRNVVRLSMKTMQIVDIVENPDNLGQIGYFRRMIDNRLCEVDTDGTIKTMIMPFEPHPEEGDRIVIDPSETIVLRNLGKDDEQYRVTEDTGNVTFDDVGGQEEAKAALNEAVILPRKHQEIFAHYGQKPVKGVQLYGPPGCGKTHIVRALHTEVTKLYGKKATSTGFLLVKGPEILSKWVGIAEEQVRSIFTRAREHHKKNGYPCIVFVDEAESVLSRRGTGISSDINNTIVPAFLAEMDGMEASGALVILATNRPDILDPAVIRDGRIDRKIKIDRPNEKDAHDIFRIHLKSRPIDGESKIREFAKFCATELYSSSRALYQVKKKNGEVVPFTLGHVSTGAMIAGIVQRATSNAIYRDIERGGKATGLREQDMTTAISKVESEQRDLDHTDVLAEFVNDYKSEVAGMAKIKR